jgi:rhodanese-related sulfurtransferase
MYKWHGNPVILLAGLLLYTAAAWAEKPFAPDTVAGTTRITAETVIDLAGALPNLVIIDNRHAEEFAKGHIEGAINLLDTELRRANLTRLAPRTDTPLLFYCNGERCLRSSHAAKMAVGWGYTRIYWFRGGWQEWMNKQLPITR